MNLSPHRLALAVLRWGAPRDPLGALARFAAMLAVIHLLSLTAEWLLVGGIAYDPVTRLWVTAISGGPFLAIALYSFSVAATSRRRLRALAMTDPLTELPNRRAFLEEAECARTAGMSGYLAILDADNFKRINDTLGHDTGDRALVAIARQMHALTGRHLKFARLGGEEFGVLATGPLAADGIAEIERALCDAVRYGEDEAARPLTLSMSGGVAALDEETSVGLAMRRADMALYRAKSLGRGRMALWCEFDEDPPPAPSDPLRLVTTLRPVPVADKAKAG